MVGIDPALAGVVAFVIIAAASGFAWLAGDDHRPPKQSRGRIMTPWEVLSVLVGVLAALLGASDQSRTKADRRCNPRQLQNQRVVLTMGCKICQQFYSLLSRSGRLLSSADSAAVAAFFGAIFAAFQSGQVRAQPRRRP